MTHLLTLGLLFHFHMSVGSYILLRQDVFIFNVFDIRNYIEITQSVMPKTTLLVNCAGDSQGVQLLWLIKYRPSTSN